MSAGQNKNIPSRIVTAKGTGLHLLLAVLVLALSGCGGGGTFSSGGEPTSTEAAQTGETSALRQVQSIQLPGVEGRIDHMAVDLEKGRLFVAALGNSTLEVIDLRAGKRLDAIEGLEEPQDVAYVPGSNRLLVSNGGAGSLDIYDAQSLRLSNKVELEEDPDNIRYDPTTGRAYVGYGKGNGSALGIIDTEKGTKVADVELSGHPESFQLERKGERIFVNVPTAGHVAVVDREKGAVVETWPIREAKDNFPMALDETNHRLFVGTRNPAKLLVIDTETCKTVSSLDSSGDADDIFYDAKAKRIYVSGGEGAISIFEQADPDSYRPIGKVDTAEGARTSLFVAESDTLYLAVPHRGSQQAEVRAFKVESEE